MFIRGNQVLATAPGPTLTFFSRDFLYQHSIFKEPMLSLGNCLSLTASTDDDDDEDDDANEHLYSPK